MSPRTRRVLAALVVAAAVLAAFQPALTAEFQTSWDDGANLLENDRWRGLGAEQLAWMATTFHMGHWQPSTWLSFALDHAVWGLDPTGYHLTNVALHALTAVLFLVLCRAVLRAAGSPAAEGVLPALVAALIFAVHPLRVASVAWITERRDVLSGLLLVATLVAWLRWRESGERRWYTVALGVYALSLTAKAWGFTLPAVLLVLDAWPLRRLTTAERGACAIDRNPRPNPLFRPGGVAPNPEYHSGYAGSDAPCQDEREDPCAKLYLWRRLLARLVAEKLPFVALALPTALLALAAQRASGATDYAADFTLVQKAAQACYGLCYYVVKTILPLGLLPVYTLDTALDPAEPRFLASFAGVALGIGAALALRRRAPALATALAIYAIVVAPVLGLTQSGIQLVADRYTYLATMPFAVLLAAVVGRLPAKPAAAASAVVLLALGLATHVYARAWHDSRTLFEDAARRAPDEWWFWSELGTLAFRDGDVEHAIELYDRALAREDRAWAVYENRGLARMARGNGAGALADWSRAIELNEHAVVASVNRGNARMQSGDLAGAHADYERAVRGAPDGPGGAGPWLMLGTARLRLGDEPGAREALARALALAAVESPVAAQAERMLAELEGHR